MKPVATRSVLSFFSDLHAKPSENLSCRATSCWLASGSSKGAYCLGFCDRKPPTASSPIGSASTIRSASRKSPVTGRIADGDFSSLEPARARGAYETFKGALTRRPELVLEAVETSGERGRGGAGFPTGMKWRKCAEVPSDTKYVVANGDEGDPGSFIDRILMERDPHAVLEGMALCAYAIGAKHGIVYIRSEYPKAIQVMERSIAEATAAGLIGYKIGGSTFSFEVAVFAGMGSYVCGEETALLNSIEGKRGEVRLRPPYPVEAGLWGKPTVVNNVETLVNIPWITAHGGGEYRKLGTAATPGTKAICLNHGFAHPGIVEVEFGRSLRDVLMIDGGGFVEEPLGILLGGPMGTFLTPDEWDVPICYGAMGAKGIQLGHGGIVAVPLTTDPIALAEHLLTFMADESCGKCVPCRLGSKQALSLVKTSSSFETCKELLDVVSQTSLCAFGQSMPGPVLRLLGLA